MWLMVGVAAGMLMIIMLTGHSQPSPRVTPTSATPQLPGLSPDRLRDFQNRLQAHPEIDTVFACSDLMALGAVEAIAAAGKTGRIRVVGFDALDDAKKAIAAGSMDASVAQFPAEMGRAAIESAVKVIHGEKLPDEIKVKLELVTRDNVK